MRGAKFTAFVICLSMTFGCASLTNRQKTLITMGFVGVASGVIGAGVAGPGENQPAHGALWGGLGAAGSGALSLFIFDEESKRVAAETKATKLEKELSAYNAETTPELLATSHLGLSKPLPEKFRHLITPGEWSLYRIDRWESSSDSELIHQDLIFRFRESQLNPSGKAQINEGVK